ncbi:MAG: protein kinase, partial [Planctomycetaceae bacterium]
EVLLATDTRLKRKVAIKRVLGEMARSRTAVRRFLTEAQSIAALNHPNIVQIYDYGRDESGPFLILEYVKGNNLLDRCREGALSLDEAVGLTCQICDGLGKAHGAGIIHRDIKPANVLMTEDGVPKLTDFGLAKDESADSGVSVTGAVLGTLDFMAPEQRQDAALTDARSDLWSLAATLYQIVTGKSPKVIKLSDVPLGLQEVMGKALEDVKDDRYQTAAEFHEALKICLLKSQEGLVALGEGQCPTCGTKNESDRKFCRGCGGSLAVPCMSCGTEIPMWEEFCGSCGCQQSELVEQRRSEMDERQRAAEAALKDGLFDKALATATDLRDESDLRLQHLQQWSQSFITEIEDQRRQQSERVESLFQEAQAHLRAFDYSAAYHTLQKIPEPLRTAEIDFAFQDVVDRNQEVQQLKKQIRQRVENRELDGLTSLVDRYLELQPDSSRYKKLRTTLAEREQKQETTRRAALQQAQALFDAQKYGECCSHLETLDPSLRDREVTSLQDEAADSLARSQRLLETIMR